MNTDKLQDIAGIISVLEKQCQDGVDIESNMQKMDKIISSLNMDELLTLAALMEDIDLQS